MLNTIATSLGSSLPKGASGTGQQREYKVITQKDKWFSGKFDPEKVEGVLNSYAKQGWVMKGVATASVPGFGGQRDEIVIIMERVAVYTTTFEGIKFVEGCPPSAKIIKPIRVEIGESLDVGPVEESGRCKAAHGQRDAGVRWESTVVDFKYGQRSVGFWRSLFDRDDVHWYGEGKVAVLQ